MFYKLQFLQAYRKTTFSILTFITESTRNGNAQDSTEISAISTDVLWLKYSECCIESGTWDCWKTHLIVVSYMLWLRLLMLTELHNNTGWDIMCSPGANWTFTTLQGPLKEAAKFNPFCRLLKVQLIDVLLIQWWLSPPPVIKR